MRPYRVERCSLRTAQLVADMVVRALLALCGDGTFALLSPPKGRSVNLGASDSCSGLASGCRVLEGLHPRRLCLLGVIFRAGCSCV